MKRKLLVFALLALLVLPVMAQDSAAHFVNFDGFGFNFDSSIATNVNIVQAPGDPLNSTDISIPHPSRIRFTLYNDTSPPDFGAPGEIHVFRTTDFETYDFALEQLQQLQILLADRSDLTPFMQFSGGTPEGALPYLPMQNANQVIRPRAQYVDTDTVSGISYLTVFRQDVSPFVGNEFLYTFQGLSANGEYYVAASFRLATSLFPTEIPADFDWDAFNAEFEQYLSESVTTLNDASPDDFTPSLTTLDAVIQSFTFPTSAPDETPGATETPTVSDPGLGGLAGSWMLVSYGAAEAPQTVLEGAPVTLVFSSEGAGGNASCNQYSATFQYDRGAITFSNIISTLMACADEIMSQENTFLGALETATSYTITDGQLQIVYPDGVLTFAPAEAEGEQDTTSTTG